MNILKEIVNTVRHNIRIMVVDVNRLDELEVLLDRLVTVSQFNPCEAMNVARLIGAGILEHGGWADCAGESGTTASEFIEGFMAWFDSVKDVETRARVAWGYKMEKTTCVARWVGGKHKAELWEGPKGWSYQGNGCRGYICPPEVSIDGALTVILSMIARGRFLPDNARLGMKRVQ